MKRFLRLDDPCNEFISLDLFRCRFSSPFKPRAPTPPRSKDSSPKNVQRHIRYRTSSVDSAGVSVLRVPFDSVNYVNQQTILELRKKHRGRKFYLHRKRNSGTLEKCY